MQQDSGGLLSWNLSDSNLLIPEYVCHKLTHCLSIRCPSGSAAVRSPVNKTEPGEDGSSSKATRQLPDPRCVQDPALVLRIPQGGQGLDPDLGPSSSRVDLGGPLQPPLHGL